MVVGDPSPPQGERTIVITGTPRGGTTMVAGCVGTLGVPIGVSIPAGEESYNLEDPEFQSVLHRESPGEIDLAALRALIVRRNSAHQVWGFKLPMALNSLPILEQELRNPRFVLVFRDPLAVSSHEVISVGLDARSQWTCWPGWCGLEVTAECRKQAIVPMEANRGPYLAAVRKIRDKQDSESAVTGA